MSRLNQRCRALVSGVVVVQWIAFSAAGAAVQDDQEASLRKAIERLSAAIEQSPSNIDLYSRRGTAYFQLGQFRESLQDFDKMIALDPSLEASHWRRGITLFYLEDYKNAARQFEIYHTFDDVDRENGIWRFLCQAKAYGLEAAREGLLKYKKDDREPFPDLYALFAGRMTGDEVLARIEQASISEVERQKRLFYADLYIGLYSLVQGETDAGCRRLQRAVENQWGRSAGGGPGYMWHVARVHSELLKRSRTCQADAPAK